MRQRRLDRHEPGQVLILAPNPYNTQDPMLGRVNVLLPVKLCNKAAPWSTPSPPSTGSRTDRRRMRPRAETDR